MTPWDFLDHLEICPPPLDLAAYGIQEGAHLQISVALTVGIMLKLCLFFAQF